MRLLSQDDLVRAVARLEAADPTLIGMMTARVGVPALRQRSFGFAGLAQIIVGQQVSTASAAAIFGRLAATLTPLTAATLLDADPDVLRLCGLSGGKIRALRTAAEAAEDGRLDFSALSDLPVETARAALMSVPGVGPWTASAFLLFGLGHADAFPSGDLALQEAARMLLGQAERPTARDLDRLAEHWRPDRGAAAHLLWAYYRAIRSAGGARAAP